MEREIGYYWVKRNDTWEIGYWSGGYWELTGGDEYWCDVDFDEIEVTQIMRTV